MPTDSSRLAAFPLLADLPAAELYALAAVVSEVEVDAGTSVVTRDYGTTVYFVEEGEAEVLSEGGEGQAIGVGDAFGERRLGVERVGR